jgi:hypothetical protein
MKQFLPFILLVSISFASCQRSWNQSDKDAFKEACMDDAKTWVNDPSKARTYCDCVMIKLIDRYPNVNDALDNIELLSRDPDIQTCRIPILK